MVEPKPMLIGVGVGEPAISVRGVRIDVNVIANAKPRGRGTAGSNAGAVGALVNAVATAVIGMASVAGKGGPGLT